MEDDKRAFSPKPGPTEVVSASQLQQAASSFEAAWAPPSLYYATPTPRDPSVPAGPVANPQSGATAPVWPGLQPVARVPQAPAPPRPAAGNVGTIANADTRPNQSMSGRSSSKFPIALALATLVAVGGVAFAAGRLSGEGDSGGQSAAIAAAAGGATEARAERAGPTQPEAQSGAGGEGSSGLVRDKDAAQDPATDAGGNTVPIALAQADPGADISQEAGLAERPDRSGEGIAGRPALAGLQGNVSGFTDDGFVMDAIDGTTTEVETDASTAYVLETAIDRTDLVTDELVRIQFPFARGATDDAAAGDPSIASVVTVLPSDAAPAAGRRSAIEGSIVAVADGGLMLILASGETELVPIDASTTFVRTAELLPESLQLGDTVKVQLPRGGPGDGTAVVPSLAEQITVVAPVTALAAR